MFDKAKVRIRVARDNRILHAGPPRDERGRFAGKAKALVSGVKLGRERIKLSTTPPEERAALDAVKAEHLVYRRNKLAMANALVRTKHPLFGGVKQGRTPAQKRRDAHLRRKAAVSARSTWLFRERWDRHPDRGAAGFLAVVIVLLWLSFWGTVLFVAFHFLAKVW